MICKLRREEPSLSSINEKSFESRRVRTQPCTRIGATGAVLASASFSEVGESIPEVAGGLESDKQKENGVRSGAHGPERASITAASLKESLLNINTVHNTKRCSLK